MAHAYSVPLLYVWVCFFLIRVYWSIPVTLLSSVFRLFQGLVDQYGAQRPKECFLMRGKKQELVCVCSTAYRFPKTCPQPLGHYLFGNLFFSFLFRIVCLKIRWTVVNLYWKSHIIILLFICSSPEVHLKCYQVFVQKRT